MKIYKSFSLQKNSEESENKKCTECLKEIPFKAKKCSYCGSKQKRVLSKKEMKIIVVACLFFIILGIIGASSSDSKPATNKNNTSVAKVEKNNISIGDNGYLRLPGVTDKDQIICLGQTKEDYELVTKSILAKDLMGVLEIPGAFCVGNGTKIQLIDTGFAIRKVRIIEAYREIDMNKVLMSGWVAMEWVSKN